MSIAVKPRRPRRIASDEAHAWARNLKLGNPHAKFVLCMLAGYVNGDGACFVSIGHLAEDCELVENTVRRRLAFLEEIGAVARAPQWIDDVGRRNSEGRGRRTSDEIRLLLDADPDEIEARARDEADPASGAPPTPAPREGSNPAGPALGVHLPFTCVHPLISEPEPEEIPPNPPSGGVSSEAQQKRFQEFKTNYPDGIVDLDAAEREYAGLTEADQVACNAAVLAYRARCERRREKSMKAHLFVRKTAWRGLLASPQASEMPALHEPGSEAGRALLMLGRIARYAPFALGDGRISYRGEIGPRLLKMADTPPEMSADDPRVPLWATYQIGSANFAAWRGFINEVFAGRPLPRPKELYVPWPWPPRKDGTLSATGPPGPRQDLKDFADMG